MACGGNKGCGYSLVKKVLLSYDNFIEFLQGVSGKIYVIWGNLKLDIQKPLHLEKTSEGTTIELKGYIDEASKDEEGNYTSGIMSALDKEKLDSIPEEIPIYNIVEGNGLTVDDDKNVSMGLASTTKAGAMSSSDKKKLNEISVSGVTKGNGLSVDSDGNISMGLATQTEAGAMSAADKTKLDSLSTDVATDEKNGLMSKEDKVALDALTSDVKVEFDNPRVLFTNDMSSTTVTAKAYMGGATVPIDEWDGLVMEDTDFTSCASASAKLSGGVIQVTITRKALLKPMSGSLSLVNVVVGGMTYSSELVVSSADNAITVLQGQVMPNYPEDNQLEATLWTFNGAKPTVRFLRKGAYWVNLPSSWQSALGNYDTTRLNVQVTMGGKDKGAHVYCGRFEPGEDYNGDKASTDCWAAVLVLMSDVDNNAVDAGFYITVSYVPSVGEYICTKEEEQVDDDEHTVDYGELTAELSYPAKEHSETSVYPEYSYTQKWTLDGVEQEPLTTGGDVKFELVENYNPDYYDVSVNENTGEITATAHVSSDGTAMDHSVDLNMCRVKMTVTLNNVSAEATADVVAKGNADGDVGLG